MVKTLREMHREAQEECRRNGEHDICVGCMEGPTYSGAADLIESQAQALLSCRQRVEKLERENESVKETWRAIADLGSTFAGGRRYNEWVRLGSQMDRLCDPDPPTPTSEGKE